MQAPSFEETIEQIVAKDARFQREAYFFVREALDHTQKMIGKAPKKEEVRHVTGQQLLDGIRDFALQQFGPMALTVLEAWGIRSCEHFGEIVFNMVETKVLSKTENDRRDDFKNGYDFNEAFRKPFLPASRLDAPQAETRRG
jgi:uncharacterized repeat protein (TIGR04138 family)